LAKRTSGKVCVLSDVEVRELQEGRPVSCKDHRHIPAREAFQMALQHWQKTSSPYFHPIAEWVGPRHIRLLRSFSWGVSQQSVTPEGVIHVATQQMKEG
jgi:hypothetical protein